MREQKDLIGRALVSDNPIEALAVIQNFITDDGLKIIAEANKTAKGDTLFDVYSVMEGTQKEKMKLIHTYIGILRKALCKKRIAEMRRENDCRYINIYKDGLCGN